jgi:acetyltransferase-like isoleucine patch superfamily enzyme
MVSIGNNVVLCAVRISSKFGISVGDNSVIEESAIMDTDFHSITEDRREPEEVRDQCCISIGRNVSIGARSIVCKGVTIGEGALIFPGTLVNKDVPAGSVVAGNPVRPYRGFERRISAEAATTSSAAGGA